MATVLILGGFLISGQSVSAIAPVALGVTQITPVKTLASADGTYANGWSWVFDATVPTNETTLNMKFPDWTNGSDTIPAAANVKFFSVQSLNASNESSAIIISSANAWSDNMYLNPASDLDPTTQNGGQIQITVEVSVPVGSAGGSYSTSYSIQTNPTLPVITITGQNSITISQGSTYTDAGATATDNVDPAVTVIPSGTVDTTTAGTYTITYTAIDVLGDIATATRTVNVLSNDAKVTSSTYTIDQSGLTITNVPIGISKTDFEAGLVKDESHQTWNDAGINDPVVTGNTLSVTAQDGTTATYTISVTKVVPTITWLNPSDIVYGTALSDTQLNAATPVPGTFVYTPSSGTTLGVGTQTLSVTFIPTNTIGYAQATKTVSINVTPVALTISGITASNKMYDTTTNATIDTSAASLAGVLGTDDVSLDSSKATANFADKNAGTGKIVTVSGLVLTGSAVANYTLIQPTTTADITPSPVLVSFAARDKVYDGTTTALISSYAVNANWALGGRIYDFLVVGSWQAAFEDPNIGSNKVVHITNIVLGGNAPSNYTWNTTADTTASITSN